MLIFGIIVYNKYLKKLMQKKANTAEPEGWVVLHLKAHISSHHPPSLFRAGLF